MSWNSYLSSGGVRSSTFTDYDTARKHFETVKPIRGRSPELKPLGSNRAYTQCQIEIDELTWGVSATLYSTQCVTIYPDKTIKLHRDSWLTPSTANFIDAVLPTKFGTVSLRKRRLIYKNASGQEYVIPQSGLMLQASDDWSTADIKIDVNNEPKLYEYKADRKVLNAIRKTIKPLLDTVNVMSAMSSNYTIQEVAQYFPDVINDYVAQVNEHKRKMKLKEEGDEEHQNYYGYFYGTYTIRNLVASKAGLPAIRHLSEMGEYYKKNSTTTANLYRNRKMDTDNVVSYLSTIDKVFRVSEPNKPIDAESIRKLMLSIVLNDSNYASENRHDPEVTVSTMFGDVPIGNLMWSASNTTIENYIIDVIKYVYADLIFKQVEVPYGTLPSVANDKYVFCNKYLVEQEDILTRRQVVQ